MAFFGAFECLLGNNLAVDRDFHNDRILGSGGRI